MRFPRYNQFLAKKNQRAAANYGNCVLEKIMGWVEGGVKFSRYCKHRDFGVLYQKYSFNIVQVPEE